jgi:hypothetical protein
MTCFMMRLTWSVFGLAIVTPVLPAATGEQTRLPARPKTVPEKLIRNTKSSAGRLLAMGGRGGGGHHGGGGRYSPMMGPGSIPWVIPNYVPASYPILPLSVEANRATVSDSLVGDTEDSAEPAVKQACRFLRLKNATGGKLTVYLQYRTELTSGKMKWYPADPQTSPKPLTFVLNDKADTYLTDEDWSIQASRVRIWAVSERGEEWGEFKDKDLWLVPEVDQTGHHCYSAPARETFTHTFER